LRALAVTSLNRLPTLPGLPTVAESGYPGFECGFWWGFLVPANTPKEIIATLHAATVAALKQPEVARRLEEISFTPVGDTPEAFGAFIKAEIEKWGRIVRELGVSAD
jgi:tripartite-type tricarboxylate transporter receptor subunit TctC